MSSRRRCARRGSLRLMVTLAALGMLASSGASALEPCPTWFPDFRCDRSGRFDGFVGTMQMPYLFEDPFITTGAQLVGIYHEYPGDSVFRGGQLGVLALQLRVALTDRLAFIATKDGYVWHRPDLGILPNEDGFFDISMGFKYAAFQDREKNYIVSPSFRIDIPVGQTRVYQNLGSGVGIPAISAAWGWEKFHVIGDFGARLPFDMGLETTSLFWNLHFDYALFKHFVPLVEFGGMHWTGTANGSRPIQTIGPVLTLDQAQAALRTGGFEGVDVANLGSRDVAGNSVIIATFGARVPVNKHLSFGAAYGFPVSSRKDVWDQRATVNMLLEF